MTARATKPRAPMVTEETTLEILERLPPVIGAIAVHTYLITAYWAWWMTLFVPAFILWRVYPQVPALAWATVILAVLAIGGVLGKSALEGLAKKLA